MKKAFLFLLVFTSLTFLSADRNNAENDYEVFRTKYSSIMSCGGMTDSTIVVQTRDELLKLDSSSFTKNFHLYYKDLGWVYYLSFAFTNDKNYLSLAIENYLKSAHITKDYWDIAFCYVYLDDCEKGMHYLELYKSHTKKKHQEKDQIKILEEKCKK